MVQKESVLIKIAIVSMFISTVVSSLDEPMPGWIDNFYGPVGIVVAASMGVLKSLHVKLSTKAYLVPVDFVANCILASAWRREKFGTTKIYNFVGFPENFLTWGWSRPKTKEDSESPETEADIEPLIINRGPYFDKTASKNVTALVGKTTYLNCRIRNLGNRTVSWIRHRDLHLLTAGRSTYTSDQRFSSIHNPMTEDWTLQVRYPQRRDSGVYECQVGTTPPIGFSMILSVVEPITTLLGGPEMYINKGSTMNLTCIVKHSPEPPPAIYWTHNSEEINYDSPRGGVSVITEKGDITFSYLLVQRARDSDSGKYTCNPSNANPKTVIVHVLNGEHPAAMQHGGQLRLEYPFSACLLSILVALVGP